MTIFRGIVGVEAAVVDENWDVKRMVSVNDNSEPTVGRTPKKVQRIWKLISRAVPTAVVVVAELSRVAVKK